VVAPDLRGYHLSDKPASGYDLDTLALDVAGLIRVLGAERASVVGHDWGGVIAIAFAYRHPELLEKLAVLNAPHLLRFSEELRSNPVQMLKSSYTLFFQLPWLPEQVLSANDCALIEAVFRHPSVRPGTFSDEDLREYRRAAAVDGALSAALNYYRSALDLGRAVRDWQGRTIAAPTLVIWGVEDFALETSLADGFERFFSGPLRVEKISGASHWIQQEAPDEVNRLLLEFL
jgi:pimeloyl-ACP methyl ester carboxylesterase